MLSTYRVMLFFRKEIKFQLNDNAFDALSLD